MRHKDNVFTCLPSWEVQPLSIDRTPGIECLRPQTRGCFGSGFGRALGKQVTRRQALIFANSRVMDSAPRCGWLFPASEGRGSWDNLRTAESSFRHRSASRTIE